MSARFLVTTRSRKTVRAAWDRISWDLNIPPEVERLVRVSPFIRSYAVAELPLVLSTLPTDDVNAHLGFLPAVDVLLAREITKERGRAWLVGIVEGICSWSAYVKKGEVRWAKLTTTNKKIQWEPTAFGASAFPIPWRRCYTWAADEAVKKIAGTDGFRYVDFVAAIEQAGREQTWDGRLSATHEHLARSAFKHGFDELDGDPT